MRKHPGWRHHASAIMAIVLGLLGVCIALVGCGGGGGGGSSGPGSVTGSVVDLDTQAPINGALVTISGQNDTTGPSGEFEVTGLQNGPQTLAAEAASQGYLPTNVQVDVQGATALPAPIQLAKGSTGPPPPPTTISGTVSLNGSLAPGGTITVEAENQATGPPPVDSVTLTAPGSYGLLAPGAATYTVTASATGFQPDSQVVALPNLGDTVSGVNFTLSP
ncbi:MAG: carboxypeptidase regulatory-like domain-containing protein [Armatimonadota bacterium]